MARIEARLDPRGAVSRRRSAGAWEPVEPRTDWARVDATTEAEIERQSPSTTLKRPRMQRLGCGAFVDEPDFHKMNSHGGSVYPSRQCVIGNGASSRRRAPPARFCA
jgi:hypothetical protein